LTRSERRIVELAAAGRLNREIAEALVVTLATVEYHLRNAYRKLGVTSRKQLPHALAVPRRANSYAASSSAGLRFPHFGGVRTPRVMVRSVVGRLARPP
jgi:DNA-binding CsgD family transcriptional regulator